ncbi:MAG TPA: iron ABC transporter permease [Solirubrobacteraceae bacterium]|nr:iron ABC transporter permease [Solirubrobacteraceae bacterium]
MSASFSSTAATGRWTRAWSGRRRWPLASALVAATAAALVLLPLVFLVVEAQQSGWSEVRHLLLRHTVAVLLWNTVRLALACTALCALLGVTAAWCVERTALPGRRAWAVALVLPLGVPDFVVAFGWISIDHALHGYLAAVMIMTLSLYPLVYLPVAAALSRSDASLEEAARSLGLNAWQTFAKVTLRQIWPAVLGGCLLVTLALLAEFGAFEIVQYRTFTVEIFTQFKLGFDTVAACALSLVLVALGLLALAGELAVSGRAAAWRTGPGARRQAPRRGLGRWAAPVLCGLATLVGLALGAPLGALVYWMARGSSTTLPTASIFPALAHTAELSAAAAAIATVLAIPVSALAIRHRGRASVLVERLAYLPMALPGLVVALGLVSFTVRYAFSLYQSSLELVVAYAILFLPLAVVGVRAAIAQAPPRLEEVGRTLGCRPASAWLRVTLPLIAPGVAAAFALVFISAATELTATLLLHPTGVNTLATQFWAYTSELSYGAAAPYALLMVAISAVPAYLLTRRMSARAGGVPT